MAHRSLTFTISSNALNFVLFQTSTHKLICLASGNNFTQRRFRYPTTKRRKTHPFRWWVPKEAEVKNEKLTKENEEFVVRTIKEDYERKSLLKQEALKSTETGVWTPSSKRTGLLARKIGIYPMWLNNGRRILSTLLQVNDNHVIRSYTAEEYDKIKIYQTRWISEGLGCMVVGAEGDDPLLYSQEYIRIHLRAGVPPKKKLTRMFVTDDALLEPGTPLNVNHFRVGDYVDCSGVTIDHGFAGVRKRWGFKGLYKEMGVTKAHNRPGSIGMGRKISILKGKKMPGHWGSERRTLNALKIMRINTKYNVIYVKGPAIPGPVGGWVRIFDTKVEEKCLKENNPPPFPTFFENDENKPKDDDLWDKSLQKFSDPTIIFVETEAEKKARDQRTGAKLAKVRSKK